MRRDHRPARRRDRHGAIIVLTAFLIVVMLAVCALALDIGFVTAIRTDAQRAVDSGALAGASRLGESTDLAEMAARDYATENLLAGRALTNDELTVQFGQWDPVSRTFTEGGDFLSAIRVVANERDQPLFFSRIFGNTSFGMRADAVATFQPRDIMVVLDYSASMNDDSEFGAISAIGRDEVEANLLDIYTELGSPTYGTMQFDPVYIASDDDNVVLGTLGLNGVPYPYPSGSWNAYINYVQGNSVLRNNGYRKQYGYMTLVNYWLHQKPAYSQTPDLWMTSEQPITAVKDSLQLFLAHLQQVDTDDRIGLAIYNGSDGEGLLEMGLTDDYQTVEDISRGRQAGHYHGYTNTGGGMEVAREELETNGREGAYKMIVLMTDGLANWNNNRYSTSAARAHVLSEANLAAADRYPIMTISLGAGADADLMEEVAEITRGISFNIPGGQSVDDYQEELEDAFRRIADHRPSKLVE